MLPVTFKSPLIPLGTKTGPLTLKPPSAHISTLRFSALVPIPTILRLSGTCTPAFICAELFSFPVLLLPPN